MRRKWHPDRNKDNKEKAEKKFTEIAAAYETLMDPDKRQVYDQVRLHGVSHAAVGAGLLLAEGRGVGGLELANDSH